MEVTIYIITGLIGLVIGSFLNVLIYRVPEKQSIVWPSSTCPNCSQPIKTYDNIPLISFFLLKGKCRSCQEPISIQYPLVELFGAALAVLSIYKFGISFFTISSSFFLLILLTVTVIDLQRQIIPNRIIIPATVVAATLAVAGQLLIFEIAPLIGRTLLVEAVIGFILGGGFLLIIALLWQGGMGGGDIKLAAFMGIFLGRYVVMGLFIGFLLGSIAGMVSIAVFKKSRRDLLPFGPFLSIGSLITLLFGPAILNWYLKLAGL